MKFAALAFYMTISIPVMAQQKTATTVAETAKITFTTTLTKKCAKIFARKHLNRRLFLKFGEIV